MSSPNTCLCILLIWIGSCGAQSCDSFSGWDDYIEDWERIQYLKARSMYPYGSVYCDNTATDLQLYVGLNPQINFLVPYYGAMYHGMWVSQQGFVALDEDRDVQTVPYVFRETWPNPLYPLPGERDPPFIAPFYAKADFRVSNSDDPSNMFYSVLDTRRTNDPSKVSIINGMLAKITADVRRSVIGAEDFDGLYGIIITWDQVSFHGRQCAMQPTDRCNRNTYQMVLVTDEISTYVIFNYYDMTWVGSSTDQGCNPAHGTSFDYPDCKPAYVGFNAGSARGFTEMPYSGTDKVSEYDTLSGSNVRGRWYFDVTGDIVRHGGCTNDTNLGADNWPLVATPLGGPMLGGNLLTVGGPCFTSTQDIVCRFGSVMSEGFYVNNMMKARCVAPRQTRLGPVDLEVSVTGGASYYFKTQYLVEHQEKAIDEGTGVTATSVNGDWLSPSSISLTWDPDMISSDTSDELTVKLIGYREDDQVAEWKDLYTFSDSTSNDGELSISPESNMCEAQNDEDECSQFLVGMFRLSDNSRVWNPASPRALWSSPVPLAWFTKATLEVDHGEDWADVLCREWHAKDSQTPAWRADFDPCPCTLSQIHIDTGRFVPDLSCHRLSGRGQCEIHQSAKACYRATRVTEVGGSSICCYNDHNNLMYAGDSTQGSYIARSSPSGRPPYSAPPSFPMLSHFITDVVPYYMCCKWQSDMHGCFSMYTVVRPTIDCSHYIPPAQAVAYGDPHFITFDDKKYTFNGYGEFWLMRVVGAAIYGRDASFQLQARMEQPPEQPWGHINGTYMTSIAMSVNNGLKLTFTINPESSLEQIHVRANARLLNFSSYSLNWQEFSDFVIINNDRTDSLRYSNFTVAFRVGVGIEVTRVNDLLQCRVTVPPGFKNHTEGLLGSWNDNSGDDFNPRPPGIDSIPPDSSPHDIYNKFGLTWRVQESETLFNFLYRSQLNYNWYNDHDFTPAFSPIPPSDGSVDESDVSALCGSDDACRYDYFISQSADIARASLQASEWHEESRDMGQKVLSCGWLEIPNSIKREPISYLVGSEVTITGCRVGFQLEGTSKTYTCTRRSDNSASWNPGIAVRCVYTGGGLTAAQISIIAVPSIVGGLLLIVGIIALCLCLRKRHKKKQMEKKRKQADQEEFQDLDVIGYGKSNMFYNPNNPVVSNVGRGTLPAPEKKPLPDDSNSTAPIQMSTPKVEPLPNPNNTLQKKIDSSASSNDDVFFDKANVDGTKIRSNSMHSMDKMNGMEQHSPPRSDKVLLPESPKNTAKRKKKKEKKQQPGSDSDATASSVPYSDAPDGRPRRPALGPAPSAKPKADLPAPGKTQAMQYQPQPVIPVQSVTAPIHPVAARPHHPQHVPPHHQTGNVSDSSGSQGYYQQDMAQFYRQKERQRQWQDNHRPAQKSRPYQYPTAQSSRGNTGHRY